MKARVVVTLKKSVLDPQGQAVTRALGSLGFSEVKEARLGKIIELDLEDKVRAEASGFDLHLVKPVSLEELVTVLDRHVASATG